MLSFGSYIAVLSFSFNTLNEIHINKMQVKIILILNLPYHKLSGFQAHIYPFIISVVQGSQHGFTKYFS